MANLKNLLKNNKIKSIVLWKSKKIRNGQNKARKNKNMRRKLPRKIYDGNKIKMG